MHYSAYRFWWLYLVLFFAFLFVWYLFCLLPYCENKSQCGSVKDYQVKVQEAASALKACCNGAQEVAINDNQIDELRRSYGGSTGEVTVTLAWQTTDDLDLHLREPSGETIYFQNKTSKLGGQLDIDKNAGGPITNQPIENIFYANKPKPGKYRINVHYFSQKSNEINVPYTVFVKIDDQLKTLTGVHYNVGENHSIYEFIIP
jgi:hypothetical protein